VKPNYRHRENRHRQQGQYGGLRQREHKSQPRGNARIQGAWSHKVHGVYANANRRVCYGCGDELYHIHGWRWSCGQDNNGLRGW